MNSEVYGAVAFVMRYWFILVIGLMLVAVVVASVSEYKQRKQVIGKVSSYVGYIEIVSGPASVLGTRIGVTTENLVGSSRNADIYITDPSIAKNHAMLAMKEGALILTPMASAPTKINGRRAAKAHQLFTGDIVSFGNVDVYVYIRQEEEHDD